MAKLEAKGQVGHLYQPGRRPVPHRHVRPEADGCRPSTAARSSPIDTNVRGIRICEHLPKLAANFQHFALLRSVTHTLAAHELGTQYVITGNRPIASLRLPELWLGRHARSCAARATCLRSSPFRIRR